jgi:hypothetical protein
LSEERLAPDVILSTDLSGAVGAIQDDPDSPDGNWLTTTDNNSDHYARVSFASPTGNPQVGADMQEFRALVRKYGGTGTPTARIELWENGVLIRAGGENNVTGPAVIAFTWNANELSNPDGSQVECYVYGSKTGGSPTTRASIEIGAVEWNCQWSLGAITGAMEASLVPLTMAAIGDLKIEGSISNNISPVAGDFAGEISIAAALAAVQAVVQASLVGQTGFPQIIGNMAAGLSPLISSENADVKVTGVLMDSLSATISQMSGKMDISGALAAALSTFTSQLIGEVRVGGALEISLSFLTNQLLGEVPISGDFGPLLVPLAALLAGDVNIQGGLGSDLMPLIGTLAGDMPITAELAAFLPTMAAEFYEEGGSWPQIIGELAGEIIPIQVILNGEVKVSGEVLIGLQALAGLLAARLKVGGEIDNRLKATVLAIEGEVGIGGQLSADLSAVLAHLHEQTGGPGRKGHQCVREGLLLLSMRRLELLSFGTQALIKQVVK